MRVPVDQIQLVMADTALVPNDGTTAGSRTTRSTVAAVRKAAATGRELLVDMACERWEVDRKLGRIDVRRVCQVFECGAIQNPANLRSQVERCIIMGMGGALREEIHFENGKILNASFRKYQVPRFADVPELDIHLLDRRDFPLARGGETPIIAIAPAVANAVFEATGVRVRSMPIRGPALREA